MNTTGRGLSFASGEIRVDLAALVSNFRALQAIAQPAEVAAVVKADAYGLGAVSVSEALAAAGCGHFFVAQLDEALIVRGAVAEPEIYILNGLAAGSEGVAESLRLTPVLNSLGQLERWRDLALARAKRLPAVIQLDTGMSRLGLPPEHLAWLAENPQVFSDLEVRYLMSHLACAETPDADSNVEQLKALEAAAARLPATPLSLANSAATLALPNTRRDLVRCGLALYGRAGGTGLADALRPVVRLTARVLQVRTVPAGAGVGYGLTYRADGPRRIATISVGYADGVPRALGDVGAVYLDDDRLPIVGRVSMDTLTVDATDLPAGAVQPGAMVELIGPHQRLEDLAAQAGAIPHEILTGLGRRLPRTYQYSQGEA